MRDFVDTLPLRLASVVAVLVGMVCLWNGVDLWESAQRIGIAFAVLLLAGLVVRRVVLPHLSAAAAAAAAPLSEGKPVGADEDDTASTTVSDAPITGKNVNVITPGTPIADLLRDDKADE